MADEKTKTRFVTWEECGGGTQVLDIVEVDDRADLGKTRRRLMRELGRELDRLLTGETTQLTLERY